MPFKTIIGSAAVLALGWPVAEAHADESVKDYLSVNGASISVGGGVVGFTDNTMRDYASVGGAWDARIVYGTRTQVAVEAGYTGGAVGVDALGLDNNSTLVSSGVEVLGRVNLLNEEWQPYVVAGVGWRRYSLVNTDANTSSVADSEDLGEIPMGAGVAYRYQSIVIDARALFRAAFNDDLIRGSATDDDANLHNWQTQITAGYEF